MKAERVLCDDCQHAERVDGILQACRKIDRSDVERVDIEVMSYFADVTAGLVMKGKCPRYAPVKAMHIDGQPTTQDMADIAQLLDDRRKAREGDI